MNTLPFYLNDTVGAHGGAEGTADAGRFVDCLYGMMSLLIDLVLCKGENTLGASVYTKAAALALIGFKSELCHFKFSFIIDAFVNGWDRAPTCARKAPDTWAQ